MAFPTGINFTGYFNLDTNLLRLTDSTDYSGDGSGWVAYYTALGPDGSYFWVGNSTNPDTTQASPILKDVSLPTDGSGNVLTGIYVITINQYKTGVTHTVSKSLAFEIVKPTVALDFSYNQFESSVTVKDNTVYIQNGITPSNSILTELVYPSGLSYDPYPSYPTPLSTFSNTLSVIYDKTAGDGLFVKGKYTYRLEGTSLYDLGNGFSAGVLNSYSSTITPTATYNMAAMYCCLKNLKARMDSLLKVNLTLYNIESDKYASAIQLMEMIRDSYISNQLTDCESYITEFYSVTGCTDDCCTGCSEDNSIQLIVPISFEEHVEVISNSTALVVTKTTEKTGLNNFYTKFALTLNTGLGGVYQKVLYIDPNGDDDSGIVGSPVYPFKTFAHVNTLVSAYDLIIVNPGSYTETVPFNSNASYYLHPKAILTCSNGLSMTYNPQVYGYGEIITTSFIIDGLVGQNFYGKFYFERFDCSSVFNTITNSKLLNPIISSKILNVSSTFNVNTLKQSSSNSYLKIKDSNISFVNGGTLFNMGQIAVDVSMALENININANGATSKIYNVEAAKSAAVIHKNVVIYTPNTRFLYGTGDMVFYNNNNCYSNVTVTTETSLTQEITDFIVDVDAYKLTL